MRDLFRQFAKDFQHFLTARDIKIIVAVFAPPLGVFLHVGLGRHFWLNIFLTLLAYLPGLVHAIWVVNKTSPR